MPFHFSLQPVFRLRQSLEERERLRLAMIIGYLNQLNQLIEKLDQEKLRLSSGLEDRLKAGITAGELQFELARKAALEQQKKGLRQQLAKLEEQRAAQKQAFREAQRKRKIVENLRDLKLELYRQEEARREQQRVDDLFGLRHGQLAKQG
ncbi:MAG TPA: flagellar export protein FliJ [Terriglobia bacterium]|nr:flagellar export protein FliJ [Terriglobia bacterium]